MGNGDRRARPDPACESDHAISRGAYDSAGVGRVLPAAVAGSIGVRGRPKSVDDGSFDWLRVDNGDLLSKTGTGHAHQTCHGQP